MSDNATAATAPLGGFAHDQFAEVQRLFAQRLSDGTELGASFAVSLAGEPVVDLWGDGPTETAPAPGKKTRWSTSTRSPKR